MLLPVILVSLASALSSSQSHRWRVDALLLLMTLIWGTDSSIVKRAFTEIDPSSRLTRGRLVGAAAVLVGVALTRVRTSTPQDVGT